jgi:putative restriction endonuclease
MTELRCWSFLTIEGSRQYGGNTGYNDDPVSIYRYDSSVPNHLQVKAGDVAVIRTGKAVLGIAEITKILKSQKTKERQRCPECGIVNIKERKAVAPRWRCRNGHVFDTQTAEHVHVTAFEAHYSETFVPCGPGLSLSRLNDAVLRPSAQMSIREIDLARIEPFLDMTSRELLARYIQGMDVPDPPARKGFGGIIDERRRVLREIALRRGQTRFRKLLIERYGLACQVSGCEFAGLVEAAHITPFAVTGNNDVTNGMLLRSDLHTLFDLRLLAIEPLVQEIRIHPALLSAGYAHLEGAPLQVNGTAGPDADALKEHWNLFLRKVEIAL